MGNILERGHRREAGGGLTTTIFLLECDDTRLYFHETAVPHFVVRIFLSFSVSVCEKFLLFFFLQLDDVLSRARPISSKNESLLCERP